MPNYAASVPIYVSQPECPDHRITRSPAYPLPPFHPIPPHLHPMSPHCYPRLGPPLTPFHPTGFPGLDSPSRDLLCVPSCPLWFRVLFFRSRAMSAITAIPAIQISCAAQNRRASTCHRERAAHRGPRQARLSLAGVSSREPNDLSRRSPLCSPLPASLSQRPTPHRRFVENKSRTPIRKDCRPDGRSLFSRFSGLQSCSISA